MDWLSLCCWLLQGLGAGASLVKDSTCTATEATALTTHPLSIHSQAAHQDALASLQSEVAAAAEAADAARAAAAGKATELEAAEARVAELEAEIEELKAQLGAWLFVGH